MSTHNRAAWIILGLGMLTLLIQVCLCQISGAGEPSWQVGPVRTGGGEAQILDNLCVLAGEAEYGRPEIQHTARTGTDQPPPRDCKMPCFHWT